MNAVERMKIYDLFDSHYLSRADFAADDAATDAVFRSGRGVDGNRAADGGQGLGRAAAVPVGTCLTWGEGSSLQHLQTVPGTHQKVGQSWSAVGGRVAPS